MHGAIAARKTKKGPRGSPEKSCGAPCRIRTYDILIRSQTLYPAELMAQRMGYNRTAPGVRQDLFQKSLAEAEKSCQSGT